MNTLTRIALGVFLFLAFWPALVAVVHAVNWLATLEAAVFALVMVLIIILGLFFAAVAVRLIPEGK